MRTRIISAILAVVLAASLTVGSAAEAVLDNPGTPVSDILETEPATQSTTEPATQPTTEPATQPTTEPATQPTTEPATQPTTEPATQPTTEPATQPTTEPATQPTTEPATQPTTDVAPQTSYNGETALGEAPESETDSYGVHAKTVITMDRTRAMRDIVIMAKSLPHSGFQSDKQTKYAETPKFTAPHKAGSLNTADVQDALNAVKMVRYIAGLPYEHVQFTDEFNNIAQHGSVLLAASNQFSHGPTKPSNMDDAFYALGLRGCSEANISAGRRNISSAVVAGFIADSGQNNISRAGHRRWILRPGADDFGIGYAQYESSTYGGYRINMHVFGGSGSSNYDSDTYVAWPSSGDFPIQYFTATYPSIDTTPAFPWSVNLGAAYGVPKKDNATLTLKRLRDNKTWVFDKNTPDLGNSNNWATGKHFAVDNGGYGMGKALVFRPDTASLGQIKDGDQFTVTIEGITDISGEPAVLEYTINFFDLNKAMQNTSVQKITVSGENDAAEITVNKGALQMYADVKPESALDHSVTWSVINGTGIAEIDENGLLKALFNGTVTVVATANDGSKVTGKKVITISGQDIPVAGIILRGENGADSITVNGDTLKIFAGTIPSNPTVPDIDLNLEKADGDASLSTSGILTPIKNGIVTVKAAAKDGSGATAQMPVTISGQHDTAKTSYTYTIQHKTDSTENIESKAYSSGTRFRLTAPEKMYFTFSGWSAGAGAFDDASSSETVFTMPGEAVEIIANYTKIKPKQISVDNRHVILSPDENTIQLTLLGDEDADLSKAEWSSPDENTLINFVGSKTGKTVTVRSVNGQKGTALITAELDGYTSTATVEVLTIKPKDVTETNTEARLLENKAAINTAKTTGALVPFMFIEKGPEQSATVFSGLTQTGSKTVSGVELQEYNKQSGEWETSSKFEGSAYNDRYIEIKVKANATAKTTPKVKVLITPEGSSLKLDIGTVDLTVTEKYPKITFTVEPLDLFCPDKKAKVTAISDDGACTELNLVFADKDTQSVVFDKPSGTVSVNIGGTPKTGTYKATAEVKVDGYVKPYKTAPKVSVKVANTVPKLKLSATTVTLLGQEPASLQLLSADSKRTLESYGEIESVTPEDGLTAYLYGDIIMASARLAGKYSFDINFKGGIKPVTLSLTVKKIPDFSEATISSKTKSVVINTSAANGIAASADIIPNASNLTISDWEVTSTDSDALPEGIRLIPGENKVSFEVISGLTATTSAARLKINSASKPFAKPLEISLTITGKSAEFTTALKGKVDIANPMSEITATVKTKNTSSAIESVKLYEQSFDENKKLTGERAMPSRDFEVVPGSIAGNTFRIRAKHKNIIPAVKQALSLEITLASGETLKSWSTVTATNGTVTHKDKPIAITPSQSPSKVLQSAKAVTLYKDTPLSGEDIGLSLLTPANVKLSAVVLNESSYVAKGQTLTDGGFELVQSGADNWILRFKDGKVPAILDKNGNPVALKSSYTLKLQLWPEGTYTTEDDGMIKALGVTNASGNFTAKSKPASVSVKVSIK